MAEESNEKFWLFLETVQELAVYKQTGRWCAYYNFKNLYLCVYIMCLLFLMLRLKCKCLIGLVDLNIKFENML